jgi:hypothetical protein
MSKPVVSAWLSLVVLSGVVGCADPDELPPDSGGPAAVSPLEAAGQSEFFVTVIGADGTRFGGESSVRPGTIPAIRFRADVVKPDVGTAVCRAFSFIKAAGPSDPAFFRAMASGETLRRVLLEFVRGAGTGVPFVWQSISLTGLRASRVEQAVALPDQASAAGVLEEVSFEPNNSAMVTFTSTPLSASGVPGAPIVTTFTCNRP